MANLPFDQFIKVIFSSDYMCLGDVDVPGLLGVKLLVESEEVQAAVAEAPTARLTAAASVIWRLVTAEAAAGGQGPQPPGDPGPVHQSHLVTRGQVEDGEEENK